jgi:hypothetical protein
MSSVNKELFSKEDADSRVQPDAAAITVQREILYDQSRVGVTV